MVLSILPAIDKAATIQNVREFFYKDFPRLVAQSHINLSYIQSPNFNRTGNKDNVRNTQEDQAITQINAKDIVIETMRIINNFPKEYKVIIKSGFINNQTNLDMCDLIGCGSTKLNQLKKNALVYFADAFTYIDLHVYKDVTGNEVEQ
ncbi:ArpU family phage packaging/lysis transcriptional regulator [Companilactobacillus jidongensis]|uniref:ArpU family phage packaging/lysis transcriptional regulator n=1 Tax=Companilactobacillus jidongensis TaxID=2486006 RepID=UPI000F7AC23D|nr:ArpU family phage packaging/lysis transcriptional regulator [Companilactobacillus jidongensis]